MPVLHGDVSGLKASQVQALNRLYRRRVLPAQIVGAELARVLCELSVDIGRQLGVMIDRRGQLTHVIVGSAKGLFIPELGRHRAGRGRFRGIRLLHVHLDESLLDRDDLTDLVLLRLDLVGVIRPDARGLPIDLQYATLLPPRGDADGSPWLVEGPVDIHRVAEDYLRLIQAVEGEFAQRTAALDVTDKRDRTILVGLSDGDADAAQRSMAELRRLAETAGLNVIDQVIQRRRRVDPRTVIGRGKLEDVVMRSMVLDADLLLFDRELSPSQGRTVADATELKVLDRTQLILDIFAQHATSRGGRLQVELAQLRYLLPRLSALQKSLSRLTGGIGARGPGETTLEVRARRARDRIVRLERQLVGLSKQRALRRRRRKRVRLPTASIVGYTNAGKSTLLNALTHSDVRAEDRLFATVDPISRRLRFPRDRELIVTDTVGFIERLPDELLKAFRATLEELEDADLLLHVLDASSDAAEQQHAVVMETLGLIGLNEVPAILVLNKADAADPEELEELRRELGGVPVSALTGQGLDVLERLVQEALWREGYDVVPSYEGG